MKKIFLLAIACLLCLVTNAQETCPNDEIWYTSMDGNVVKPNSASVFGAKIVSNTYSEGKGVIKFDGTVTSIGDRCFYYCSLISSVIIPNSVTTIGLNAFYGCTNLTNINLPNTVTSIGNSAFVNCKGLKSITIPDSVIVIEGRTFSNCTGLTNVIIPNSVTSILGYAFYGCSGLTSINIPNSVTSIENTAFSGCSGIKNPTYNNKIFVRLPVGFSGEYQIPEGIEQICNEAFKSCTSLTNIIIPNSVTTIGKYAFDGCSGVTNISIPNSVKSIGSSAFCNTGWWNNQKDGVVYLDNCLLGIKGSNITGLYNIKEGTRVIAGAAFYGCSGLTSIIIPNSVTSIGDEPFGYCSGLESVYVKWDSSDKIPSIDYNDFYYRSCDLYVPKGTTILYYTKDIWKTFRSIQEYVTQVTLPASGVASFSSTFDMAIPSGVNAYYATKVEDNYVVLEPIADTIPANTGVVLKGTASTTYDFIMTSSASPIEGNILVATDGKTEVPAGKYVISGGAFHPLSENYVIPAGKAYLNYSKSSAKLQLDFGNPTDINDVREVNTQAQRGKYFENGRIVILNNNKKYNLAGQRLN